MSFFWAKTGVDDSGQQIAKPVLHHLIDVAAVAWVWLGEEPAWLARIARSAGLEQVEVRKLIAFCAGLHDLGKYSIPFQAKSEEHWPEELLGCYPDQLFAGPNHWEATACLLANETTRQAFENVFPAACDLSGLISVVAGHHGVSPAAGLLQKFDERSLTAPCCTAAVEAINDLLTITELSPLDGLNDDDINSLAVLMNGIITLCDWVGSDSAFFSLQSLADVSPTVQDYWPIARAQAQRALVHKGLLSQSVAKETPTYHSLSLVCASNPRPAQLAASEIALSDGPQLVIIEDSTGAGKTEAALLLAARMIAGGKGEGIYFALPTMATANAMHGRLSQVMAGLFGDEQASLALLHGRAALAKRLSANSDTPDKSGSVAAWCNDWISSNRRLGLLADVGVGTVDQAFLTVLQKKHVSMRQAALSRRVLVIDEAHCFDAYMGEELSTLLRTHARNGGSAIVLSATLADSIRQKLIAAWQGSAPSAAPQPGADYPLISSVSQTALAEIAPGCDAALRRTVTVERLPDRPAALEQALVAAAEGAAVAIICNAVDEAVEVYRQVRAQVPDPEDALLFHARFAVCDRMAIEARVLELFGKTGCPVGRQGKILVSTQVVEQSLDLDFDLVISDLAPVDALVQRAGRLWRHMDLRPAEQRPVSKPQLLVISPDPASVDREDWLEASLGVAAFVYRHPGVMWRSAAALFARGALTTPDDLRPLLAKVYGPNELEIPECLQASALQNEGETAGHRALAKWNLLPPHKGYSALGSTPGKDETVGTRLGEETVTIRLARRENGRLRPWSSKARGDERLNWELSEVSLRQSLWQRSEVAEEKGADIDALRAEWPEFEQEIPVVVVDATSDCLTYSPLTGFLILPVAPPTRG